MKCIKCGAYVYSSDKFCRSCGTTLNSETCQYGDNIPSSKYDSSSCHEEQYNYSYEYSNKNQDPKYTIVTSHSDQYDYSNKYSYDMSKFNYTYTPNDSGEDKYIKAYVGKNYDSIKKLKFSFPALIFGPMYFMYRKIWGYALAAIIIILAATFLLDSELSEFVSIIINIFLAFKFQSIYMKQAEDKVEMIKQQNLDKSTTELLEECKKKGGTTFKGVVIAIILVLFLYISLLVYLVSNGGFQLEDTPDNVEVNTTEELTTDKLNQLYYKLPRGYQVFYSTDSAKKFSYSEYNVNCTFHVETRIPYGNYIDPNTYLNSLNYPSSGVNTTMINHTEWLYKQVQKTNFYQTIYAHKHNDMLYIVTLDNSNYYNCKLQHEKILNSLTFSPMQKN